MTRLFILAAILTSATAAAAQHYVGYGTPSPTYGSPLPDATNNAGVRNYQFDVAERGALTSFQRRALKKSVRAPEAVTTAPAAPPAS